MRNNDQSNRLIKWIVTVGDFCLLNAILLGFAHWHWRMGTWQTGPIFFKQLRTGLDGRDFYCYKFRSMHVNNDADRLQATKDDPRKYPFGNFMRKANIDELPQFWNVLKGDMSIVGPRPHILLKIKWIDPVRGLFKNTSRPVSKIRKRA